MSKNEEQDCWELITKVVAELGELEKHVNDVSELRRLHASLILGMCKDGRLSETKEEFLEGFNSYDSPFPRIKRWFKNRKK